MLYYIADGGNRSRDNHHGAKETIVQIAIFHDNFETYTYNYVPTYFKFNVTIKVRYMLMFPAGRGLYLCWEAKEKRPLPRSDPFSVAHVQKLP